MEVPNVATAIDKAAGSEPPRENKDESTLDEKMKEAQDPSAGQTVKPEIPVIMPQLLFKPLPLKLAQQLPQSVQITGVAKKAALFKETSVKEASVKEASTKEAKPLVNQEKEQRAFSLSSETSPRHTETSPHQKGEHASAAHPQKTTAENAFMQNAPAAADAGKSSLVADTSSRLAAINMATLHMSSAPAASAAGSDTQTLHYVFQHGEGKHAVNIQTTGSGEQRTLFMQPSSAHLSQQLRTELVLNPVEGHTVFKEAYEDSQHKRQHQQREDEEIDA